MKRIAVYSAMTVVLAACGNGGDFDATGTFEATEVLVSAEAAGRILSSMSRKAILFRQGNR